MTNEELIKILKKLPKDALIIVNGHSDGQGYNEASDVTETKIAENKSGDWEGTYYAPTLSTDTNPIISAIHIS